MCPKCPKQFTRIENCRRHIDTHYGVFFTCHNCGKSNLKSESGLNLHLVKCLKKKGSFICKLPRILKKKKKGGRKHCKKAFLTSEDLFVHKCQKHWKIKPWTCTREACSGSYYRRKDYLTHIGTENRRPTCYFLDPTKYPLKRYVCKACTRRFNTLAEFKQHIELFCRDQNGGDDQGYVDTRRKQPPAQ